MKHFLSGDNYKLETLKSRIPEGQYFYHTEFKRPIYKNTDGELYYEDGMPFGTYYGGLFQNKPLNPPIGFGFFCTDKQTTEGATNGIMIYHKGNNVWVDALGRIIE